MDEELEDGPRKPTAAMLKAAFGDDTVSRLRELRRFLNGEAPLDGVNFGDRHPTLRGPYWWRAYLNTLERAATEIETETALSPVLRGLGEGSVTAHPSRTAQEPPSPDNLNTGEEG